MIAGPPKRFWLSVCSKESRERSRRFWRDPRKGALLFLFAAVLSCHSVVFLRTLSFMEAEIDDKLPSILARQLCNRDKREFKFPEWR